MSLAVSNGFLEHPPYEHRGLDLRVLYFGVFRLFLFFISAQRISMSDVFYFIEGLRSTVGGKKGHSGEVIEVVVQARDTSLIACSSCA